MTTDAPAAASQAFRVGDRVRPSPYALTQCAIWLIPKMARRRGTVSPVLTWPEYLESVPDEFGIEPATTG